MYLGVFVTKKERKVNKLKTKCKKLGDIMLEHFEKKDGIFLELNEDDR